MEELHEIAKKIRKSIVEMTYNAGEQGAHIGGSLSLCEILSVLYCRIMKINPQNMLDPNRDRLILSKGHGVLALYAILNYLGVVTNQELASFKKDDSIMTAHPQFMPEKGLEFASGSLGQGLAIGAGVALGLKNKRIDSRVFVVLGDGECDEGSVWESAAFSSHMNLNNLICIVDQNGLQYDGRTDSVLNMGDLVQKWRSFGWDACSIDGHSVKDLIGQLNENHDRPFALICRTVKGKGISFIEDDYRWHNAKLSETQYLAALKELD
jgi:transketolase